MRITMIGHDTVLVESAGTRLLTDPYFGTSGHLAYARTTPPAASRDEIGRLDGVLVSHSHWDHTDRRFFRSLDGEVPVLAPAVGSALVRVKGARSIVPMRRWQSMRIGGLVVTAVPALHLVPAVGFVVQDESSCLYFAGDTFYRSFMAEIGRRFPIDVALLPVTTFRIPMTMGEKGAVRAVRDLDAAVVIPIHLGVQPRSPVMRTRQTPGGFERRLRDAGLETEVVHLANGESWAVGPDSAGRHQPARIDSLTQAVGVPRPDRGRPAVILSDAPRLSSRAEVERSDAVVEGSPEV